MMTHLRTATVLVSVLVLAAGCSTPRAHDLAAGTARYMSEISKASSALGTQISQTTGALQSVVANARSDPREAYAVFSTKLNNLAKMGEDVRAQRETVHKQGQAYFAEWEKSNRQIGDESLRRKADARRNEVNESFRETEKQLDSALDDFGPLLSQLQDVRAYLSSDLSSAGIEGLRGRIGDLGAKGRAIQKQLGRVEESVQELLPELGNFPAAPKQAEGDGKVH